MRPRPHVGVHRLHDPEVAFDPDPARALACLRAFVPDDEAQARCRVEITRWILEKDHPFERRQLDGHLTASALVLDPAGERALLTHHAKLDKWLQFGGHCDGDANLAGVALREATEESGLDDLVIDPRAIDLDVHAIPARGEEPEHLHLDVRFLVWTGDDPEPAKNDESHDLAWVGLDDRERFGLDGSVARLFERARRVVG